jgi:hypothetical protein
MVLSRCGRGHTGEPCGRISNPPGPQGYVRHSADSLRTNAGATLAKPARIAAGRSIGTARIAKIAQKPTAPTDRQIFDSAKGRFARARSRAIFFNFKKRHLMNTFVQDRPAPVVRVADHRIDIAPARRLDNASCAPGSQRNVWTGHNKYFVNFRGETIGEFRCPMCESSRWLLANGLAAESDSITSYRDGRPSMSGRVGVMAKLTVTENRKVGPVWAAWKPFPDVAD